MKTGDWEGYELSDEGYSQIYIPEGYYHGFYTKAEENIIEYKCTEFYDPKDEIGVIWNDKALKINWPAPHPIVSEKDSKLPKFKAILDKNKD